jgi:hypothetical protein
MYALDVYLYIICREQKKFQEKAKIMPVLKLNLRNILKQ